MTARILRRRYGHARSRKVSLGFQVVNTATGETLSEIFPKRAPAREIAARLHREHGTPTGVRHLEEHIAADTYPAWKAARKGHAYGAGYIEVALNASARKGWVVSLKDAPGAGVLAVLGREPAIAEGQREAKTRGIPLVMGI